MNIGNKVLYIGKIYEVGEIKSDHRGLWVKLTTDPRSTEANPATGTTAECWFLSTSLESFETE